MKTGLTDKQASTVKIILFIQTILIVLLLCMFFWEAFQDAVPMLITLFGGGGLLVLTGVLQFYFVKKWKLEGKIKKYLIFTGFGATGFLIFTILHNFFYGVGVYWSDIAIVTTIAEVMHMASFFIATLVCPASLLLGLILSYLTVCKVKEKDPSSTSPYQ